MPTPTNRGRGRPRKPTKPPKAAFSHRISPDAARQWEELLQHLRSLPGEAGDHWRRLFDSQIAEEVIVAGIHVVRSRTSI